MSYAMEKAAREAFLAETRVGVLGLADGSGGPLLLPVWYAYEPGGVVRFVTGGASRKVGLLRSSGRASLIVQSEEVPYRYVSVEGPVSFGRPDPERDVRAMAIRYLGPEMGEVYLQMTAAEQEGTVLVELRPERWRTVDYSRFA